MLLSCSCTEATVGLWLLCIAGENVSSELQYGANHVYAGDT